MLRKFHKRIGATVEKYSAPELEPSEMGTEPDPATFFGSEFEFLGKTGSGMCRMYVKVWQRWTQIRSFLEANRFRIRMQSQYF